MAEWYIVRKYQYTHDIQKSCSPFTDEPNAQSDTAIILPVLQAVFLMVRPSLRPSVNP